jgi:hypothetical protein
MNLYFSFKDVKNELWPKKWSRVELTIWFLITKTQEIGVKMTFKLMLQYDITKASLTQEI